MKGFTLVELLIALTLSLFLLGMASTLYLSSQLTASEVRALNRAQENIRFATDFFVRDIRNAGYRDRAGLSVVEAGVIDANFAEVLSDGKVLVVRYAGRGGCGQAFSDDQYGIVTNTYQLVGDQLQCNGETIAVGLTGLEFELIYPPPATSGACDAFEPATSCLGVRVRMEFAWLGETTQQVEVVAAFRNLILERMNTLETLES